MKKRPIRFYCTPALPFWLYILDSDYTLKVLLACLLLDIAAILVSLTIVRAEKPLQALKQTLPTVYLSRSLVWFVGEIVLVIPFLLCHFALLSGARIPRFISDALLGPVLTPWSNPLSLLYNIIVTLGCGFVLYKFYHANLTWKLPLSKEQTERFALLMAIFGLPLLFLVGNCLPFLH